MLFVGTSIIHPSTEGVFLLCNILDLLIYSFNGFGLLDVEFIGKENEISNFKIVIGKLVYDYIYSYYLGYTRTKTAVEKYGENMYIVRVYYAFSKKTLKQFELYFNETSEYKKREILEQETVKDKTLEQEMKKWNV